MLPPKVRSRIEIAAREVALESLGTFGSVVGPRTGPNQRSQNKKDDFCVRQMILGLVEIESVELPRTIEMLDPDPEGRWPDALFSWPDGSSSGLEITEATSEEYQSQLTKEERIASKLPEDEIAVFDASVDGYVGAPTKAIACRIAEAIVRKGRVRNAGTKYSGVSICDLLIYENSDGSPFVESDTTEDASKVILDLRFGNHELLPAYLDSFRFVHLLIANFYVHSILGNPKIRQVGPRDTASKVAS